MMKRGKFKQLSYVVREPEGFSPDGRYPLVIYLHGAGGRGNDLDVIYNHPFFEDTKEWLKNAVSVAPQCYENSWFTVFEQLQEFVRHAIDWTFVDPTRVYVVGASMGGYTTWQLAMSRPEWFAAIIPICGGGMYWNAGRLIHMSVWAFHGADDTIVFPEESKKMVDAINAKGGNAKLTIYPDTPHSVWPKVYTDQAVFDWLLSHEKENAKILEVQDNDIKAFG